MNNKIDHIPIIAHRGAWKKLKLPENSIASLKQAIKLECYGSEFDVQLTKDGVIVVCHDDDFMGMTISKYTYAELLDKELANGAQIPTLQSYLKEGMKQQKTKLILEIKPQNADLAQDELFAKMVLAEVCSFKAEAWVEYISFSYAICQFLVKNSEGAMVYYLGGDVLPKKLKEDGITGADYQYQVLKNNPKWIEEMKQLGLKINTWTVERKTDIDDLLVENLDFITTNEPELIFKRKKR